MNSIPLKFFPLAASWQHCSPISHPACHTIVGLQWNRVQQNSVRIIYIFHVCDSSLWWLSVQRSALTPPCPPINSPPSPNCSTRYTLTLRCCPSIKHSGQGHAEFSKLFLNLLQVAWQRVWWRLLPCERTMVQMPIMIIMIFVADFHFFPPQFFKSSTFTHCVLISLPVPICAFQAC